MTSNSDDDDDDVITSAPRAACALGAPDPVVLSGLDEAIASVRRRTSRLTYLIIRREYLPAWCEACDLRRALEQADVIAFAVLELPDTADSVRRLNEARRVADAVLDLAPTPSPAAIQHAFAPAPHADHTLWNHEMEQWMMELAALKPRTTATGNLHEPDRPGELPAARTIRRSDARPDSPAPLRANHSRRTTRQSQRGNE
jgi:hypothetical protein